MARVNDCCRDDAVWAPATAAQHRTLAAIAGGLVLEYLAEVAPFQSISINTVAVLRRTADVSISRPACRLLMCLPQCMGQCMGRAHRRFHRYTASLQRENSKATRHCHQSNKKLWDICSRTRGDRHANGRLISSDPRQPALPPSSATSCSCRQRKAPRYGGTAAWWAGRTPVRRVGRARPHWAAEAPAVNSRAAWRCRPLRPC